jgi:hypothetical protein
MIPVRVVHHAEAHIAHSLFMIVAASARTTCYENTTQHTMLAPTMLVKADKLVKDDILTENIRPTGTAD